MQITFSSREALVALLALASSVSAHSWVEHMMVIGDNGTFVGQPGYARGNYMRSTAGFGDPTMVNLLPPDGRTINQILPSDLMCKSTQTSQTQSNGSPRLQAAAGAAVALQYQENGHVTLPDNQPGKPPNRGTVYVYGTTKASPDDSFLAIHRVWNADGTGGDGRGQLLATRNFDDGQCYQTNGGQISQQRQAQFKHPFDMLMGNDLWCQADIQLPASLPANQPYTLYWVWDWPTLPGTPGFPNGKQEIYTSCMDVDIVGGSGSGADAKATVNYDQGQPLDNAAVAAQMPDLANPTAVTGSTIAFSASATGPVSGGASEASASAATATDTGIPAFLSVHTGSTAGPGIETQTFSVIPIGAQPTGGPGGDRGGSNNGEQSDRTQSLGTDFSGPQITGSPNFAGNAQNVATVTEYESTTQVVMVTNYVTQYTKRDASEYSSSASNPYPTVMPFPPWNGTHSGPPPGVWPPMMSGRPSGRPPWVTGSHPSGPPPWVSAAMTSGNWPPRPHGHSRQNATGDSHASVSTTTSLVTINVQSTVDVTTQLPSVSSINAVVSASSPAPSHTQTTVTVPGTMTMTRSTPMSESYSATLTMTATVMIIPSMDTTATPSLLSASAPASASSSSAFTPVTFDRDALTILPIPGPAPTASTEHSAFRLRARNPFVMLGWMKDPQPTPTQSS